jgi:pyruvate dehydrogenase E2 component (dihydrolipoamide acetyltransferase)
VAELTPVLVPDIGGFDNVDVVEVLVHEAEHIEKDTPLITLETEKASMDVPSPAAGKIATLKLKRGDKVSQGSVILLLEAAAAPQVAASPPTEQRVPPPPATPVQPTVPARSAAPGAASTVDEASFARAYASPSVRKFARELGADLGRVSGSGAKGRVTQEDVKAFVKGILTAPPAAPASALPKVPIVDFAAFGAIETKALTRIQKISGARLSASWVNLPHVTQHDRADITELEELRKSLKDKAAAQNTKLTLLAFLVKACVSALREFPNFNSSLDAGGENLILKRYFHIGFAADTPNGLLVPVIRDADRLGVLQVAASLALLSEKARAGKLGISDMQGGSFTISSLGGIGGTAFTPIINAPEVAILGVSRSSFEPVYERGGFVPRLMLPLSLSYDHRVIDGAAAARFVVYLAQVLQNPESLV